MLNRGLLIQLKIPHGTDTGGIKKAIEKTSELVGSFRPIRKVPICGNCGIKDEKLADKCPTCKSTSSLRQQPIYQLDYDLVCYRQLMLCIWRLKFYLSGNLILVHRVF